MKKVRSRSKSGKNSALENQVYLIDEMFRRCENAATFAHLLCAASRSNQPLEPPISLRLGSILLAELESLHGCIGQIALSQK